METVAASQILKSVWAWWDGGDYDGTTGPDTTDWTNMRTWLGRRIREAWQSAWWPNLMTTEKQYFRDLYNRGPLLDDNGDPILDETGQYVVVDQVYAAGAEVYYPKTHKYYRSLVADNTASPIQGDGSVNSAYWAECESDYDGADWEQSTAYAVGNIRRNLDDDEYYACHTAHTSAGTFDYTKFGLLETFVQVVPYNQFLKTPIGTVKEVWDADPDVDLGALPVTFWLDATGIRVNGDYTAVWIEKRSQYSELRGDFYEATKVYIVADQMYFVGSDGMGDWYDCLRITAAGESPETHAWKWRKVSIPAVWRRFLAHAVYSDALRQERLLEEARFEEAEANADLGEAIAWLTGQQQQNPRTKVLTR